MKIFIISVISSFIISAGITIFLTGTFNQKASTKTENAEEKQSVSTELTDTKQENIKQEKKSEIPINENNAGIDKLKVEIEQYRNQLELEKGKLDAIKSEIESLGNQKLSTTSGMQLAKIYSSMKPDIAASVLCELEETLTMLILTQMNNNASAKIMDAIAKKNPEYAAKISTKLFMKTNEVGVQQLQ
ncbi:hypothetical protein FJY90_08125 [Candidatus Gottesmanbacteria bacterium]|nr:hypothetical protein [Candidatus Gottesmanbacteria bacterium]